MNSLPILEPATPSANVSPDDAHFGALTSSRGCLPLRAMDIRARIDGLMAETALWQTFVNTFDEPIEATYIFPLPDRAAVVHFEMIVGGRVVEGILKERGAARKAYRQAVSEGKRAAITEEERPGVFTLRVGNLMPGDEAVVVLKLVGPLPYADGEATFRFPLVVAPRYMPGKPISGPSVGPGTAVDTEAVPDASRISPPVLLAGYPNPVALSMSVELSADGLAITDLRSSLQAVREEVNGDGTCRVRVYPGERLDRDFILRYRLGGKGVQTSLMLTPDEPGASEGSFMLTLLPPAESETAQRPRDIVFVLDRSGSMGGWKMVAARRALARMIETLTEADRFTVYAFDDSIELPPGFPASGVLAATDRNRFRASEFLAKVESRGGTEMAQPLGRATFVLQGCAADRDRVLVLLTDGQVGNEDQILQQIGNDLRGLRVFTLGIDTAVNEAFLKRLALLGGGACDVVESEARLDAVMDKVHRRIGTAVCTGLTVRADSGWVVDGDSMVPGRLPDLFVGAPVLVLGRYRGEHPGAVVVECRDAADRPWAQRVEGRPVSGRSVACAWARGRVRELEDKYVTGQGDKKWLERTIVETSLRFGVLCRFTSYVAVDRVVANTSGAMQPVVQAVEKPAGREDKKKADALNIPVADFELSCRSQNLAKHANIRTFGDLTIASEQLTQNDKMLEEVKKELQARGLSLGQAQGPAPAAASPPPMAKRDDASDEVEFELTLEVGPSANSSDPNTLRAKLADAAPEESVFGEESGEGKDIFETDFEVPAIDEDSASQAVTMEGSNTDLESSDFDLGVKLDKEAPRESLAVFSEVDSLEEEQNEADDSAALYRSMPAPKKPTPPAPRGKAAATPPTPPQKQNLRKSVRRLDETGPGKGESLWDKVKKAADGVRKALTSPAADERQVRRATPPSMRAIPAPRVPPPPVSSPPPPPDQPGDEIRRLTIDHSLAQALVETRSITPEEAVDHKFKNVLWKYLGSKEVGDGPDVIEVPLAAGDRFLLCSDGLSGSVADDNLLGFIAGQADVQTCADGLGKLALDSGSRDNVSCIVIEVARNGSLNIGKCTLLGNYRENNEDSIEVKQLQDWTICLVADGMGGQAAGEIASKRALEVILRELRQHLPMAATSDQARSVIRKAVFQANAEILAMGDLDRALKNMGTTIVLTAWRKGAPVIYVTNLGDSRCYHIPRARGGASVAAPSRSAAPSSYADRARRLADDLTRDLLGDDADRVHRLGILAVKLAELVEDLRSVGVPEAECRPLAQTVVFLKSFVGRAAVSREEVAQAVASTEQVLRDFAGPGEVVSTAPAMVAATSQSREAFWK